MGKFLIWFIVALAGLTVWRLINARDGRASSRPAPPRPPGPAPATRGKDAEQMVRCAHCGIYLPRSEAFLTQGQTWCGPEHARLGAKT